MSDDGQVSLESSCERELSDVERLLPSRNQLIKGKESSYAVARKISQGRYGAVFEVLRQNDGRRFAAKLEVCETHSHGLHLDYTVLCQAMKANAVHFPRFIDRGKIEGHFRFVVMTMPG
ncbi:hypothetical protein AB6A40_007472 [Gnathostoma spinigerum]|uniref:Protein kinase domain-containing protein n=1 Tax=Gnathostoma spinigerum TaxID=75299 RepID=A0ABD6ELL1_9BILA